MTDYLTALREITANLEAHIERRAAALAAPRIAEVERLAEQAMAEAFAERDLVRERSDSVITELRRCLDHRDRQIERYRRWLTEAGINPLTGLRETPRESAPPTRSSG